jgi:predicted RND superfamily exporter protein
VVICLLAALVLFRGWRAVVASVGPPVIGLVWFGGWLGASGIAIDPVMGALPVVLIVLGFSDALHLWHAALHGRGGLAQAAAETAPAAVLTSVTTMIAFASLVVAGAPSLDRLALSGAVGVGVVLVAVLVLTPALLAALGVPRPGERVPATFAAVVPPALAALAWRGTPLVALLLVAGLAAVQNRSQPGFRYADYLPTGAPVTQALARAEALGLGADRLFVVVDAAPERAPGGNARAAALAVWGADSRAWIDSSAGAEMLGRMRATDGSGHALPVQAPISAAGAPAQAGIRALESALAEAGLAGVARVVGPGQALVMEGPRVAEGLRQGLYLTIAAVTVLIALIYRSIPLALASIGPNLVPILGVEAWLVATGREVSIMNMIALTVAFGMAVDDTLHLLNRLRLAQGPDPAARLAEAVRAAGPPMAATTLVLIAGLLVTLGSSLPGLAVFGGLIALAVVLALAADLFLLPALVLVCARWFAPRS